MDGRSSSSRVLRWRRARGALLLAALALGLRWDICFANAVLADTPLASLSVTLQAEAVDRLVDQISIFAKENSFAMSVRQTRPDRRFLIIEMSRGEIKILALDSFNPESFNIFIYAKVSNAAQKTEIESVIDGLESAIGKIPGATVSEKPPRNFQLSN